MTLPLEQDILEIGAGFAEGVADGVGCAAGACDFSWLNFTLTVGDEK